MAELTPQERLQPSLLDRLTDDDPQRTTEPRENRVLSPARLRESVRRDLSWLFNTTNLASVDDQVAEDPAICKSVLNFGVPPLSGQSSIGMDLKKAERALREAILAFEPRLLAHTVEVTLDTSHRMDQHALIFYIRAELWAQPLPLHLFLRTSIDWDNGEVRVDAPRE